MDPVSIRVEKEIDSYKCAAAGFCRGSHSLSNGLVEAVFGDHSRGCPEIATTTAVADHPVNVVYPIEVIVLRDLG